MTGGDIRWLARAARVTMAAGQDSRKDTEAHEDDDANATHHNPTHCCSFSGDGFVAQSVQKPVVGFRPRR